MKAAMKQLNEGMFKRQQALQGTEDEEKKEKLREEIKKADDKLVELEGKEKKRRLDVKKRAETRDKTCKAVYAKEKAEAERAEKAAKAAKVYADRIAKTGDKVAAAAASKAAVEAKSKAAQERAEAAAAEEESKKAAAAAGL